MQQPDQNALAGNEFELTAAETAALSAGDDAPAAPAAPAGDAAPAAAAEAAAAAAPAAAAAVDPAAAEAEAGAAAAAAAAAAEAAASAAAPNPSPVFVPTYQSAPRDFDTESQQLAASIKALREGYRGGDIDEDAYEQRFDELQQQRTQLEVARATSQLQESMSRDNAEQAWQFAQRQFLAIPENRGIAGNPLLEAAWGAALQQAVNTSAAQNVVLDDWGLMQAARDVLVAGGLLASAAARPDPTAAATAAAAPPKPDRTPPLANVPTSLTAIPAAAETGDRPAADTYAGAGIEDLEARMSTMSDADRENLLRGTPGMFLNNQ